MLEKMKLYEVKTIDTNNYYNYYYVVAKSKEDASSLASSYGKVIFTRFIDDSFKQEESISFGWSE